MQQGITRTPRKAARAIVRIRPGRMIVIRPPLLRMLGADPAELMIDQDGHRLVIARRPTPQEARLARFKARLASRGAGRNRPSSTLHCT
ncbi:hypothetical protein [Aromatoleum evansii]|uniref:hypothetical protein n=1 Tax=Aromatoleum evansii TaxID=59406 RepID=UPI00145CBCA8|nr:hypothetical protein [Aromatoleum evansii]NMG27962.1 hypothetical protein [Aromatoleum evansii]